MTDRREVFWVVVEITGKTMGNDSYEKPSEVQPASDVKLYVNPKRGILLISDNKFFTRLWFHISNPFRYLFTGKIRY